MVISNISPGSTTLFDGTARVVVLINAALACDIETAINKVATAKQSAARQLFFIFTTNMFPQAQKSDNDITE